MQLPGIAIKNAQFTFTMVLLLVLVGMVSYVQMPRSEDPQFDTSIVLIEVIYPGASPRDVETLVVNALEQEFTEIEGIKKIESQVKNDGARIQVYFHYGNDPHDAYNEIKQAVAVVKPTLPSGVEEMVVLKATPTSVAIIQMALWTEPTNFHLMEFYGKQLEKRLEAIDTVKKADLWGVPQQIVAVDLNLRLLHHYGIDVNRISQILQGRALNITPGYVDATTRRFNVKASGNFQQLQQLRETVVFSNQQMVLRLKDVAQVAFASGKSSYLTYLNAQAVVFITVEQRVGSNIFTLTEQISQVVSGFKQQLPAEVKTEVIFKQVDSVNDRVNGFFDNLWQGLLLVGLMAIVFLGIRGAMVVIVVIPLSFLIAIGWLDFTGFGLQQMSIVGLIIALGLLVDNAIVVTESIHRQKSTAANLAEAAALGTSKVGWAITSGTMTTLFAFLPMLMIASDTGDFLRSMPVTVILVLLASLLLALTLTPLLASKLFTDKASKVKTLQTVINKFAANSYSKLLTKLFSMRTLVITLSLVALVGMGSLFTQVGLSLFPKAEKSMLLVNVTAPANASLSYTKQVMQQVNQVLHQYPLVKQVALNIGNANPRMYYNEIPKRGVASYGQALVILTEFNEAKMADLVNALRAEFSSWQNAEITVKEFTQGPVTDQPITIRLISGSLDDLAKVAADLSTKLAATEGVINIDNPIGRTNNELRLVIDYEKAGLANIDIQAIESSVQTIISGQFVGQFSDRNGEDYPILVRSKQQDLDVLNTAYISTKQGQLVPLKQVVKFELGKGHSEFFHYKKQRMAKVSADVIKGYSVNQLTQQATDYLQNYQLPQGMYYILGGEEQSRQESFAGLSQVMIITAVGIFAILVLQFRSFLQPLIIFTTIPFAMAGSVIGLYLLDLSFSMMAFIGLISLFGIVVNNAIILIDTSNKSMAQGNDKRHAILQASATRFTPILLTTLTTIVGLLPLTLFGGSMWKPMGVVIISGLCVSALASFILVPVLTELFTRQNTAVE